MPGYRLISSIGQHSQNNSNPLNYCLVTELDSGFNNGNYSKITYNSKKCQDFMSTYCSTNWNQICEISSQNLDSVNNNVQYGDLLIANTASKKYITEMGGCNIKYEPFDSTVSNSPLISYWTGTDCIPVYEVNPQTIDSDPVMNQLLNKPTIAFDILLNIYNTSLRKNTINSLKGTKIYNYFQSESFQNYIKSSTKPQHKEISQQSSYKSLHSLSNNKCT